MLRTLALAVALLPVALAATPASAVTSEEKMETCKVGAESQQLQGAKRDAFIKKCMAGGNYEPPARRNAKAAPKPQ
jgi:psiF repeat